MTTGRRQFLALTAGASAAVAGCMNTEGSGMAYEGPTVEPPGTVAEYLSDTSNFEGEAADWTDREAVTVTVGAQANGGYLGFGPAAITITTGTTVVWEWNGRGGTHNVVAEDGTFDSGSATLEEGATFEHTFAEPGVYRYVCQPHRPQGMKGAVVVE